MGLCQNKGGHPKKLQIVTEKHKRAISLLKSGVDMALFMAERMCQVSD